MNFCTGYTWGISTTILGLSKSIMTRNSFLYQSHVQTYVKCYSRTMVSGSLGPYHCLYMQCIPAACAGPIYTPCVRWPALGLGKFLWWKEKMAMPRCINCVTIKDNILTNNTMYSLIIHVQLAIWCLTFSFLFTFEGGSLFHQFLFFYPLSCWSL